MSVSKSMWPDFVTQYDYNLSLFLSQAIDQGKREAIGEADRQAEPQ